MTSNTVNNLPVWLVFICKVAYQKSWRSVHICKSYCEKNKWHFFIWTWCSFILVAFHTVYSSLRHTFKLIQLCGITITHRERGISQAYNLYWCVGPANLDPMYAFPLRAREVCMSRWCMIVLIGAGFQLDNVSLCCELSVGLVQGCEWHWWILGEAPYNTSFLGDSSMWFV